MLKSAPKKKNPIAKPLLFLSSAIIFSVSLWPLQASSSTLSQKKVLPPLQINQQAQQQMQDEIDNVTAQLREANSRCPSSPPQGKSRSEYQGEIILHLTSSSKKSVSNLDVEFSVGLKHKNGERQTISDSKGTVILQWGFEHTCGKIVNELKNISIGDNLYFMTLKSGQSYIIDIDKKDFNLAETLADIHNNKISLPANESLLQSTAIKSECYRSPKPAMMAFMYSYPLQRCKSKDCIYEAKQMAAFNYCTNSAKAAVNLTFAHNGVLNNRKIDMGDPDELIKTRKIFAICANYCLEKVAEDNTKQFDGLTHRFYQKLSQIYEGIETGSKDNQWWKGE